MTKPKTTAPGIPVSRILMSDTLAPHHLLISKHIFQFFPELTGLTDIDAAPPETILSTSKKDSERPLYVVSHQDECFHPFAIADILISQALPILTITTDSKQTPGCWWYSLSHIALKYQSGGECQPFGTAQLVPNSINNNYIKIRMSGCVLTYQK